MEYKPSACNYHRSSAQDSAIENWIAIERI